jgi:hypothetical protein
MLITIDTIDGLAQRFTRETGIRAGASRMRRGLAEAGIRRSNRCVNAAALDEASEAGEGAFDETWAGGG